MNIEIENFISTFDPLLNQTTDALAVLDLDGECHYGNDSIKRFIGYTKMDVYASFFRSKINSSKTYVNNSIAGKLDSGYKLIHREKFIHPIDKRQNCYAGFSPLINSNRLHFGWSVIFNNRSRSAALEKTFRINSFINCLNNLSSEACIIQNFETGEIVFVSDSFQAMSGWSKNDLINGGNILFYLLMNIDDKHYIYRIAELLKARNKSLIERTESIPIKLNTILRKKNSGYATIDLSTSIITIPEDPEVYYGISFIHKKGDIVNNDGKLSRENLVLTHREEEIVALMAKGYSTKMLANKFKLKEGYISQIRKRLLRKFNVNNSTELILILTSDGYEF